ncbi:MAG: FecR domain-containing protein [Hymenobacter sp.]|nr:FecR domain-containing protein [Hymenobacter sp.]
MLTQPEFEALLERYLNGGSLPGERQLVERWSEQLGQREPLTLDAAELETVRTAMWQRIEELTGGIPAPVTADTPVVSRTLSFWRAPAVRWAAAAAGVLSVGAGWLLQHQRVAVAPHWVQQVNNGPRVREVLLADRSRIMLQPGSRLRYVTDLTGERREVYLTGQAYFKVATNPERPFLVYTDKLVTTVLGTSFTVTSSAGNLRKVAVREGRVAVQERQGARLNATPTQPSAGTVLLSPNQQAVYSETEHRLTKELVENPVVLVRQKLDFKNRPVGEVLAALEKAYGVNIVYDPARLRKCTITIALEEESLFEQLTILCKALGASYKLADDAQIIFEGSTC